jgi:hypothetical protein
MFQGRTLVIATMHGKEEVLGPLAVKHLGVEISLPGNFDTDEYGSFTGEIPRKLPPLDAARAKAKAALEKTGMDLALASEGSFGPHPVIGMIPANEEWLVLLDLKNELEVVARTLSTDTNYQYQTCNNIDDVFTFAKVTGFPEHALILRRSASDNTSINKGIREVSTLRSLSEQMLQSYGSLYLETDMRAMMNPKRMQVIAATGEKLMHKLKTLCPSCSAPGFDVQEVIPGLICSLCKLPTRSAQAHLLCCLKCGYEQRNAFPGGKEQEDPMYCDHCNP